MRNTRVEEQGARAEKRPHKKRPALFGGGSFCMLA